MKPLPDYSTWETTVPEHERRDPLWTVQAYRIAKFVTVPGWADAVAINRALLGRTVAVQLWRAVTTIAPDIAEGYSRSSIADRLRYFEYALGSTRETIAFYGSAALILPARDFTPAVAALGSVRNLLMTMTKTHRDRLPRKPTFGTYPR